MSRSLHLHQFVVQHLSDEAVAACADRALTGAARTRAERHLAECDECARAVDDQRRASAALRTAPLPLLPAGLLERLSALPSTTAFGSDPFAGGPAAPVTVLGPDGQAYFAAHGTRLPDPAVVPGPPPGGPLSGGSMLGGSMLGGSVVGGASMQRRSSAANQPDASAPAEQQWSTPTQHRSPRRRAVLPVGAGAAAAAVVVGVLASTAAGAGGSAAAPTRPNESAPAINTVPGYAPAAMFVQPDR